MAQTLFDPATDDRLTDGDPNFDAFLQRLKIALLLAILLYSVLSRTSAGDLRSCVVVVDVTSGTTSRSNPATCAARLPPASTFEIPHALVALETGVVTETSVERWDGGGSYAGQPSWAKDHTIISALRPSAVWLFQRIAPRIGADRMRTWLRRFEYGNAATSGSIRDYWMNGRLRITPDEQVRFLQRFYDGTLPVSARHLRSVRDGLEQRAGTIENAWGIHPLDAGWRPGISLNGNTGATTTREEGVSWLVGELRVDKRRHVFASAAWLPGGTVHPLQGARAAAAAFVAAGILPEER